MPSIKFSTYLLNRIPKFISKCFLNCALNFKNFLEGHFGPPRKLTFPGYILNSLLSVNKFIAKDKFVWAEQCVGLAPPPPLPFHTHTNFLNWILLEDHVYCCQMSRFTWGFLGLRDSFRETTGWDTKVRNFHDSRNRLNFLTCCTVRYSVQSVTLYRI